METLETKEINKRLDDLIHHIRNKPLSPSEAEEIIPYAKQTLFVLDGFLDFVEDGLLAYDKKLYEDLIFKLDDDYDELRSFLNRLVPIYRSHIELANITDQILTKLIKIEHKLGITIAQNEHSKK